MTDTKNILGISLGTRTIGMAMLVNGELVDWYVKAFKGKWSEQKKELILETIDRMLERYAITVFALKVPVAFNVHVTLRELHTEINLLAQPKGIATETLQIIDLKSFFTPAVSNKKIIRKKVLELYPELKTEFRKELENRNGYYTKLFEAVLAAHILDLSTLQP